jgi:phage/plasmid-like protein (TIGR03299 family)
MSHEIDFTKDKPAIAYTGDTPWHGYGQPMDSDQPLERWLIEAGMDYSVVERPIVWNPFLTQDNLENSPLELSARAKEWGNFKAVPNKKVLLRSDTRDVLSVVSSGYKVVQPKAIMEFFRDLISDYGFKMHTAGVLSDGKRVWALAETGKEFAVKGLDRIGAYLLLATSYDGKFSTTAQFTSVRVVCNNTLGFSLDRGEKQSTGIVRVPHVSEFNAAAVKGELGLLGDGGWQKFQDNVIKLSEVTVTKRQAVEFFLELLGVTEEEASGGQQLIKAKKLIAFYESGPGSQFVSAKNTTWGLVNAVSFFTDHGARAHNNGTRFNSAAFGAGAKMKRDAFGKALALAEAA